MKRCLRMASVGDQGELITIIFSLQGLFPNEISGIFQISLKLKGFIAIRKGYSGLNAPRFVLCSIGVFTGVVISQPGFEIFRETGIKAISDS